MPGIGTIAPAKSAEYRYSAALQAFGPVPRRGRFGAPRARFGREVFFLAMVGSVAVSTSPAGPAGGSGRGV
jgi:hypothetical protein